MRHYQLSKCKVEDLDQAISKGSGIALDLVKLFGGKSSVIRKRKEWDLYEPIVDLLSNEEVETLDAREERNARNGIRDGNKNFVSDSVSD
ncbi:hypothetical protein Syun_010371 [Stephania yunnanensis]|uniref:Uncharacterized protein n=1 Tax=Stephania yunnanensis TaxID=152371 RepID=A0AAP0PPX5_9MAGN